MTMRTREDHMIGDKGNVQVMITTTGKIVTDQTLEKYALTSPESKQIDTTRWTVGPVIEPPYDLIKLMNWMDINVIHCSAIQAKVQDAFGVGFFLESEDPEKLLEEDVEHDTNYKALMNFFNLVNQKEDIIALMHKVALDYEGCGNSYIEVSRGTDGKVNGLYHINATTVKWAKDKERLVQRVNQKYVWFKLFGDERILDRFTGQWVTQADPDKVANELIPVNQYTWKSNCYGLPEWTPALYAMYGDLKEREYNIEFFTNYGVPAYALIVEGSSLNKEVQEEITKYFETTLKGSNHKTLTLTTPKGTTVKFERLSVEQKEASFLVYKKDNRDDILSAHHVPPYRVGVATEGSLGGNVASEMDRIYLDSVVNPRQRTFGWIITELIIKQGLEIPGWIFRFKDIDIDDANKDSERFDRYIKNAVMSPNEVRKELGLTPYDGGDVYYQSGGMIPVGGSDAPEMPEVPEGAPEDGQPTDVEDQDEDEAGTEPAESGTKPKPKPKPAKE